MSYIYLLHSLNGAPPPDGQSFTSLATWRVCHCKDKETSDGVVVKYLNGGIKYLPNNCQTCGTLLSLSLSGNSFGILSGESDVKKKHHSKAMTEILTCNSSGNWMPIIHETDTSSIFPPMMCVQRVPPHSRRTGITAAVPPP